MPQGRQLRIDRREVRLAHGVAGQVDLPQDVQVIPDREAISAEPKHGAPRLKGPGAKAPDPQARLLDIEIPHHATLEVRDKWHGTRWEVMGNQILIEIAPGTGRLLDGEGGEG